jgi:hypothetical protein
MNKHKILGYIFLALVAAVIISGVYYWQYGGKKTGSVVTSYDQCIKDPNARILETYPEQCVLPSGQKFVNPNQTASNGVTSDWKTYTNTKYGFEFKYPKQFEAYTSYRTDLTGSEAESYYQNYMDPGGWLPVENIKIDGYSANKFSGPYCDGGGSGSCNFPWTTYIFIYKNHPLQIEFNADVSQNFEQLIFSTFKFTNSADTSTWKTYTSTKYGFEVKYPVGWKVVDNEGDVISVCKDCVSTLSQHINSTQVSVFPEGLATEGSVGESRIANLDLTQAQEKLIRDFYLNNNNQTRGYYISFSPVPIHWETYGYIWASVEVANETTEEIPSEGMPTIKLSGQVNSGDFSIIKQILSTFKFTK